MATRTEVLEWMRGLTTSQAHIIVTDELDDTNTQLVNKGYTNFPSTELPNNRDYLFVTGFHFTPVDTALEDQWRTLESAAALTTQQMQENTRNLTAIADAIANRSGARPISTFTTLMLRIKPTSTSLHQANTEINIGVWWHNSLPVSNAAPEDYNIRRIANTSSYMYDYPNSDGTALITRVVYFKSRGQYFEDAAFSIPKPQFVEIVQNGILYTDSGLIEALDRIAGAQSLSLAYLPVGVLKSFLSITGTEDDDLLLQITSEANFEVNKRLKPYAKMIPLETGNKYIADARSATFSLAKALWYQTTSQLELEKSNMETFEEKMESLTKALTAEPTARQRPLAVETTNYEKDARKPYSPGEFERNYEGFM